MIGPSGLEQEPRDHGGCHCYRQFATETFVSLWYFAFFVIVGYRTKIVNMGGWSHFILLWLSSSKMLFCRCHLFRLELWCFWMSCHLCFVLLFVILFVGNWGQRALRKEADRGEQYHNHEDGDRRGNNIILMRKEAERAGDHHLWTSSSWGEATITPSTNWGLAEYVNKNKKGPSCTWHKHKLITLRMADRARFCMHQQKSRKWQRLYF